MQISSLRGKQSRNNKATTSFLCAINITAKREEGINDREKKKKERNNTGLFLQVT